jgi:hypothetical protein
VCKLKNINGINVARHNFIEIFFTINFLTMSKCNFSIPFTGSVEQLVAKAKNAITSAGGQFTGDAAGGEFSLSTFAGTISGSYDVSPSNLNIEITDKPIFVSCSMIESELKKYLGV